LQEVEFNNHDALNKRFNNTKRGSLEEEMGKKLGDSVAEDIVGKSEQQEEKKEFYQFGQRPEDLKPWRSDRSFYLQTCYGPLTPIPVGCIVHLGKQMAQELFSLNKISPVWVGEKFRALRALRFVSDEGTWIDCRANDIIKLSREEAIPLLREGKIKELEEGEGDDER
jgi:hypothetical protein